MKKFYFYIIIVLWLVLSNSLSYSQPMQEWASKYGGNTLDHITTDMVIDDSGNVYMTGTVELDSANSDFITVKFDSQGKLKWFKTYDGPESGQEKSVAIKLDKSGNVIVTGTSHTPLSFLIESVTIKYLPDGDTLWVRKYISRSDSALYVVKGLEVDTSGNVYIFGIEGTLLDNLDLLTIKYSPAGDTLWVRRFDTQAYLPLDIKLDKFQNVMIYGSTELGATIIKYNPAGDSILGVIDTAGGVKILFDEFNNFYNAGSTPGQPFGADYYLAKHNSSGVKQWVRTYSHVSANNNDDLITAALDKENNIYVTGISAKTGELGWDYLTIKYNPSGDSLWVNRYNPIIRSNDEPASITVDKNGNTFVTGKSDGFLLWNKISTVVYDKSGNEIYVLNFDTLEPFLNHEPVKITSDTSGNIYVAGISQNSNGKFDMVAIKYSSITGIQNLSNEIPESFQLYQNYPNPFNSATSIKYDIQEPGIVKIKIYDILGREIEAIVNSFHNAGEYKVNFNAENYSSGIYYYRLVTGGRQSALKKFALIK